MMKKSILLIVVMVACIAMVFALSACDLTDILNGEATYEYTAENEKELEELVDYIFKNTFESKNTVITLKKANELYLIENIDGDKDSVEYYGEDSNGMKVWTFVDEDDAYIYAYHDNDAKYFIKSENPIDYGIEVYKNYIAFFNMDKAQDDLSSATFDCYWKGESILENGEEKEESGSFKLSVIDGTTNITMTGTTKNAKVATLSFSITYEKRFSTYSASFEYGAASVVIPEDYMTWNDVEESEEEKLSAYAEGEDALTLLGDFMGYTLGAGNVKATVKTNEEVKMEEFIKDNVDYVETEAYKEYTFFEEGEEEFSYIYYDAIQKNGIKAYRKSDIPFMEKELQYYRNYVQNVILDYDEVTYLCNVEGEIEVSEDAEIVKKTLSFSCGDDDNDLLVVVYAENDFAQSITVTCTIDEVVVEHVISFEYGVVDDLEKPDLSHGWMKEE